MYIAVTKVSAPKEALERMAEAFRRAAPSMKQFPGCTGFELWLNDETLEAVSKWESKEAVEAYAKSPQFASHHGGPGAGAGQAGHGAPGAGGPGGGQIEYYDGEVLF